VGKSRNFPRFLLQRVEGEGMKELPWFRFYPEAIYDEKITVTANRTDCSYLEILGVWVVLLALAGKSPIRGSLFVSGKVPYEDRDIAEVCHITTKMLRDIIDQFIDLEMLDDGGGGAIHIKNWAERQYEKTDDEKGTHAKYVKEWRDKKTITNGITNLSHDYHIGITNGITNLSHSVSVSDSESLIKELNVENSKKYFTIADAERLYIQVTKFSAVPSNVIPHLPNIQDMMNAYGYDDAFIRLDNAKSNWISQKNKTNGASYKLTNPAWLDYAITGETVGAPPKLSTIDREQQELEELIRKGQK